MAGAYGTLTVNIEFGPDDQPKVEVQGQGFAGIQGTLTGTVTVSHEDHEMMSGTVQVSGAVGAGAGFEADVGIDGGKITFDAKGKIVAGAGGGVSFSGSVDVANTTLALRDILLGLARAGFEEGAEVVIDTGEAVWNMGQVAGGAVWDGTKWAGRQVMEGGE